MVALDRDSVVSRAGDQTEHVLFPHSGAISVMIDMANGQTVASAAIGREGAVGTLSVLGPSPAAVTAIVRAAGTASRIPASRFHAAFSRSPAIRHAVLRRERVRGLEPVAEWDGLLIWVRVRAPEKEAQAQEILMRHGGQAVHVHEIDLEKRPEDLPLHSVRPDPWLGDERLGRP